MGRQQVAQFGVRQRIACSTRTPQAARTRPRTSGTPRCCAIAGALRSSVSRGRQRLPPSERSTFRNAGIRSVAIHATQQSIIGRTETGLAIEIMFGLDVTHRAGFRAHYQRMGFSPPENRRTPFSMVPLVTPVAANMTSPPARSSRSLRSNP